ncbi:exported hypothetical protein [Syntrophobacter sp. SbD1]|nr:exported hypothetical protein [Syntrophobacter sp. SbD1]
MARLGIMFTLFATLSLVFSIPAGSSDSSSAPSDTGANQPRFELPQKPTSNMTPLEQRGANLYSYYCTVCHGTKGEGDGINSFQLTTPPAKFADAAFMATLSDADIQKVIRQGGSALDKSPQMQPWGRVLTDQDVAALVAYIKTLSKN